MTSLNPVLTIRRQLYEAFENEKLTKIQQIGRAHV